MRVKLEWTEKHSTLEEFEAMDDGTPIGSKLGYAMDNAMRKTGLFQRGGVIPDSINFTIVED